MTGDDLTKTQAKVISDALFPGANYLARLHRRMEQTGFPRDDRLYQLVSKAHDAMRQLCSDVVHYMTWGGVGRPEDQNSDMNAKEKTRAYNKRYYQKNRKRVRKRSKAWYR
jgi:hypothetical protein